MEKLKDEENIMMVSTQQLCEILGMSARRIQQLAKENAIVRVAHGKYDLPSSIQAYIESIKEQSQSDEEMDYNKEKTLLTRANRKKAEMELKIIQGEVHRSEDVENVMNDMLTSFRAQMLVIPGKAAPQLLGVSEIESIKKTLKDMIYESLQELSDYDPTTFYGKEVIEVEGKSEGKNNKNKKKSKKNDRKQSKN